MLGSRHSGLAAAAGLLVALGGCFVPRAVDCTVRCGTDLSCPRGLVCEEGFCTRAEGRCPPRVLVADGAAPDLGFEDAPAAPPEADRPGPVVAAADATREDTVEVDLSPPQPAPALPADAGPDAPPSVPSAFPYSAVVKIALPEQVCSATKIGPGKFLTAAGCLRDVLPGQTVQISNSSTGDLGPGDTYPISRVDRHPSFDRAGTRTAYDLGILQIAVDLTPIPVLPVRSEFIDVGGTGTGVGYGCEGRKQETVLEAAARSDPDVYAHYLADGQGSFPLCPGNAGAPWLVPGPAGSWTIGGVATGASPGTFARTGSARRWIENPGKNLLVHAENGTFMSGASGLCLGIDGLGLALGGQASLQYCDGRRQPIDSQTWQLQTTGPTTFNFANRNSGLCLGVAGGSLLDGALLQQYDCAPDPTNNQSWSFVHSGGDYYQVVNGKSGKCIGPGGPDENGTPLAQFSCLPAGAINNQSWLFTR